MDKSNKNIPSKQLSIEATKEIQSKLKKLSVLIHADSNTITNQRDIINKQRVIIEKQQLVIKNVRNELFEIKKQLMIKDAQSTPQDFRDNLKKYLLNLRNELIKLQNNKSIIKDDIDDKDDVDDDIILTARIRTALYISAGIGIESKRILSDRLFTDYYSDKFASYNNNSGYNFISQFASYLTANNISNNIIGNDITTDYLSTFVAFRTKWIDDQIYYALNADKKNKLNNNLQIRRIKQIVIFGCGFDTRCFRLTKLKSDIFIYYIDNNDIINLRNKIIGNDFGCCQYTNIIMDSDNNNWINKLYKNGFNRNEKSIWICEGICEYFNVNKLNKILNIISLNTYYGSWLIGEIPNQSNISAKNMHKIWCKLGGQPVKNGCDLPGDDILNKYGFIHNQNVNILGCNESNYNQRSPVSYINYQNISKPCKNDKITRIQLFRGMKPYKNNNNDNDDNDDNDIKTSQ